MTLDLCRARNYLQGDEALLGELLALFSTTLDELLNLLRVARLQGSLDASHAQWQAFYRALHGAKPALQVLGSDPMRILVDSLSNAFAQGRNSEADDLVTRLDSLLVAMRLDLKAVGESPDQR